MAGPPPYNYLTGRACPQRDAVATSGMWFGESIATGITNPSSVVHFPGYSQPGGPPSWAVSSITLTTPQAAYFPAWWRGTITYSAILGFFYEVMGTYLSYYQASGSGGWQFANIYSGQQYNLANPWASGSISGSNINYAGLRNTGLVASASGGGPTVSLSGLVTGSTNYWSGSWVGGFDTHGTSSHWVPGEEVTAMINGTSGVQTFAPGFHSITTTVDLYTGDWAYSGDYFGYFMGGRSGPYPGPTIDTSEGFDLTFNIGSLSCSAAGTYTETGNLNPPPSLNLCSTP